jgi:hypothetical protein
LTLAYILGYLRKVCWDPVEEEMIAALAEVLMQHVSAVTPEMELEHATLVARKIVRGRSSRARAIQEQIESRTFDYKELLRELTL